MIIPAKLEGKMHFVPLEDILYMTTFQKKIMIYTEKDVFHALNTISDYLELAKPYGFEMLDRNNVVQINQITRYDHFQKVVFFGVDGARYCTVSGSNEKLINNTNP